MENSDFVYGIGHIFRFRGVSAIQEFRITVLQIYNKVIAHITILLLIV